MNNPFRTLPLVSGVVTVNALPASGTAGDRPGGTAGMCLFRLADRGSSSTAQVVLTD